MRGVSAVLASQLRKGQVMQKEVRTGMRTQAEIDAERYEQQRLSAVSAFVAATNTQGGGSFGYQRMLEDLFQRFESDYGTTAAITTVLDALTPLVGRHHAIGDLYEKFNQVLDSASKD